MKTHFPVLVLLLAGLLLIGCKEETPPTAPTPPQPPVTTPEAGADAVSEAEPEPRVTGEDVQRETGEAVRTAATFMDQEKDQFVAASQEKLDALKARWSSWKADADVKADEAKAKLNEQYAQTSAKLGELKDSSGEAWGDMKAGFVEAYQDLEAATKEAAQKFNKAEPEAAPEPSPQ